MATVSIEARTSATPAVSSLRGREKIIRGAPSQNFMRFLRKVHALIGIVSTLNLLLLITTGLLIQSRESLALEDHYVSRRYLPASYRPHDDPSGIRSDIVITDLHSGRIFGRPGVIIVNSLAVAWLVLATSGVILYTYKYFRRNGGDRRAE